MFKRVKKIVWDFRNPAGRNMNKDYDECGKKMHNMMRNCLVQWLTGLGLAAIPTGIAAAAFHGAQDLSRAVPGIV